MKYENVTACVPVLSDEIISAIEKSAGIKNLSFIIAVGPAEDTGEDKLVPVVSEEKRSDVEITDIGNKPIPTNAILDASCITLVKYDGCHWLMTPPGVAIPC
jgi:hypothetical protein